MKQCVICNCEFSPKQEYYNKCRNCYLKEHDPMLFDRASLFGHVCAYCGNDYQAFDHVIPISLIEHIVGVSVKTLGASSEKGVCFDNSQYEIRHMIVQPFYGFLWQYLNFQDYENLVPVCSRCNGSKRDRDFFDWYPRKSFFSKERYDFILKNTRLGRLPYMLRTQKWV